MSAKAVNVNDIIDRAKFSGFHFQVVVMRDEINFRFFRDN